MVTARGLVVGIIVFYEIRRILRQRIDHTTLKRIAAILIVLRALGVDSHPCLMPGFLAVRSIEVAVPGNAGHIVHG